MESGILFVVNQIYYLKGILTKTTFCRVGHNRHRHNYMHGQTQNLPLFKVSYVFRFGPFYVESVVAGLQPKTYEPYLASLDILGGIAISKNFSVTGTCKAQLYGMCEPLWKTDLVSERNKNSNNYLNLSLNIDNAYRDILSR